MLFRSILQRAEGSPQGLVIKLAAVSLCFSLACSGAPDRPSYSNSTDSSSGNSGPGSGNSNSSPIPGDLKAPALTGPSPLRRLTNNDYINSVTELVGDVSKLKIDLAEESSSLLYPFTNEASQQTVAPAAAGQYLSAAETIAADTMKDKTKTAKILSCTPKAGTEEACAKTILQTLADKAFRRPSTEEQMTKLLAVWRAGFKGADFNTGIEWALTALLVSPDFLYRIEMGSEVASGKVVRLDSWDMANRLSFFLWNSAPDDILIAAAKANALKTDVEIAAQVDRMLKDPKTKKMITHFHDQWLGLEGIESMLKDPKTFPGYSSKIAEAMREEVRGFVDDVVWKGDAKVESLLSAKYTFLNASLGDFYGVKGLGTNFEKVDSSKLGGRPVSGLLTMGALLAKKSSSTDTSPTLRGAFVRVALFCQTLPNPPDDAIFTTPASKENETRRETTEAHAKNPSCSGCHQLMDPIGLVFENFDAAGRFRDKDGKKAIDLSSELFATDVNGKFVGPEELGSKLAASKQVNDCVAAHWFQNAFARDPLKDGSDKEVFAELSKRLQAEGYFGAIKFLTKTPQFLYRTVAEGAK